MSFLPSGKRTGGSCSTHTLPSPHTLLFVVLLPQEAPGIRKAERPGYPFAHPPLPLPSRSHLQQGLGVGAEEAGAASTAGPWELLKSHWGRDLPAVSSTEETPGGFLTSSNGRTCGGGEVQGANFCLQPGLGPVLSPTWSPSPIPKPQQSRRDIGQTDLKVQNLCSQQQGRDSVSDSSGQDRCISAKGQREPRVF